MRSGARTLAVSLWLLLSVGCASVPPWPSVPGASGGSDDAAPVKLDVPFFPQERYQCGPAALATMLSSQGIPVQPDELVPQVYLPEREGSLKVELVAAARRYGLLVYPLDPDLKNLLSELDAGHPVLVMQNLGFDWFPQWHFAVLIGYEPEQEELILHTDTRRANAQPLSVFYRTWQRAGQWAAVMLPPDEIPVTATPLTFLESAHDLEVTGQTEEAYRAYAAASARWEDQPAAILGLGNIAYGQQRWYMAVGHYKEAVERFPTLAAGWNNLAHALANAGCQEQSIEALQCANRLAPERFAQDLSQGGELPSGSGFSCPVVNCPSAR